MGMRRTSTKERARNRILDDNEIRALWKVAEANGTLGALVRMLLLTGQRLSKVAAMRWGDIDVQGVWRIPTEAREKANASELPLPPMAIAILKAQRRFAFNPYVFASNRGDGHVAGFTKMKRAFDAKLPSIAEWTLHDLRRTARSLLARANVRPDIAERVLGHAIVGIEGTYNRHGYTQEKAHAIATLASLIKEIVSPHGGKVVSMTPLQSR
jgi:integrase